MTYLFLLHGEKNNSALERRFRHLIRSIPYKFFSFDVTICHIYIPTIKKLIKRVCQNDDRIDIFREQYF